MFCQYLGLNLVSCKKRERKNTQEGWTTEHLTRPIRTRVFQIQLNNSCWTVITDVIIEQLSEEQAAYRRNDRIVAGEIWQMSKCFSTLEFFLSLRSLFNQLFIAMGFDRVVHYMIMLDCRDPAWLYRLWYTWQLQSNSMTSLLHRTPKRPK